MNRMKKWIALAVSLCLVVATLAACGGNNNAASGARTAAGSSSQSAAADSSGGGTAPAADAVTLKLAHPQPAGSATDLTYNFFAEKVLEYTDGAVAIEIYPANSLINSNETMDALINGTVDLGHVGSGDVSTLIPAIAVWDVPGAFKAGGELDYVWDSQDIMIEMLSAKGMRYLNILPGTPNWLLSNKKLIVTPEDMAGLNIRVSGKYTGLAVQAWGGNPVTIPLNDLATAMERNTVDVVMSAGLGVAPFKWYELEHYITDSGVCNMIAFLAMNQDKFDALSAEQQEGFQKAADEMSEFSYARVMDDMEETYTLMEDFGNEFYELTEEETNALIEGAKPAMEQAIADGGDDAQRLYDILQASM